MKKFMFGLNGILAFLSFCTLITFLITTHFGYAWICVPVMIYFILNTWAIDE